MDCKLNIENAIIVNNENILRILNLQQITNAFCTRLFRLVQINKNCNIIVSATYFNSRVIIIF